MRYLSLFSGVEAATLAWEGLGWEAVAFCEIDPFPSAVLAERWHNVPNLGDITKADWGKFRDECGAVDLIVGGSPCQSFSIAGGRAGLDGESGLMFEYIRAIREIRPKWLLWENVPGVFSTDSGRAFGILLHELEQCGYFLAWRVLDAQFFGVAQRRRRVFLVGGPTAGSVAAVLFDRESLSGNTCTRGEKRKALARRDSFDIGERRSGSEIDSVLVAIGDAHTNAGIGYDISPTMLAHGEKGSQILLKLRHTGSSNNGRGGEGALLGEGVSFMLATSQDQTLFEPEELPRHLTPVECERLQGMPDNHTMIEWRGKQAPDSLRYKAVGNSMAVPVMRWIGERLETVDSLLDTERDKT